MKIAICDDDRNASDILLSILDDYPGELEKIQVYESGEEFLQAKERYDLLFLDIDMKGMDGIETARRIRLRDKKLKIVYVTAYSEYAGRAFSVHAFGYLLKPVKKERVLRQVEDALAYREEEKESCTLMVFVTKEGRILLPQADIYYFEIRNRKIRLAARQKDYEMKGRISDLRERLQSCGFASPHKSFVVNLDQIKNIKGYDVYLMNGEVLPLSQKQAVTFKECLSRYLADRKL